MSTDFELRPKYLFYSDQSNSHARLIVLAEAVVIVHPRDQLSLVSHLGIHQLGLEDAMKLGFGRCCP
jgi:hypothetical protein